MYVQPFRLSSEDRAVTETAIVASRIALVFALLGIGWMLRRRAILGDRTVDQLSRLVVDVAFPALVLVELIRTVSMETLRSDAMAVVLGAVIILLGLAVGHLASRPVAAGKSRRTCAFVVAMPNWIFLPLLIAEALYGSSGVRTVLMINVGALVVLWTLGVATLRGRTEGGGVGALLRNPGLGATVAGLILALAFPMLGPLVTAAPAGLSAGDAVVSTLLAAVKLFGSITVPLALMVTGAQLGALDWASLRPDRRMALAVGLRLLVVPAMFWGLLLGVEAAGVLIEPTVQVVGVIVAAMPVAVSASLFTQRFGGDVALAAPAVFWSTFASLITVPVLFSMLV